MDEKQELVVGSLVIDRTALDGGWQHNSGIVVGLDTTHARIATQGGIYWQNRFNLHVLKQTPVQVLPLYGGLCVAGGKPFSGRKHPAVL